MSRWPGRLTALAATIILLAGTGAAGLPAAAATRAGSARAPFGDYVDRLSFEVSSVDPSIVTATGATTLTITGRMTNTGTNTLVDLLYRFQRGSALDGPAAVREELAEPSEPTERMQTEFTPMDSDLASGQSAPFAFTAAIADRDGLAVSSTGVYPLLVNVNGAVELPDGPLAARIGELHLLLTVIGVPGAGATGGAVEPARDDALPVNVVWPLVDSPHLGVGGVFLDENLLTAIGPGGRLSTLVNALTDRAAGSLPADTVTVVIDPQLLDELDRMTGAYRVVADPAQPQPPMSDIIQAEQTGDSLPTATAPPPPPTTTPPTATASAAAPGATAGTLPAGQTPTLVVTAPALPGDAGAAGASPAAPGSTAPATTSPTATSPTATATATAPTATASTASSTADPSVGNPGAADIPGTIAGTGQAAAASFLQQLRTVADRYPVVTLPYGDPDVVAMVRAGLVGEVAAAVQHGTAVAQRILGTTATASGNVPVDTAQIDTAQIDTATAYPINGAVDAATLAVLRANGLTTGLFGSASIGPDRAVRAALVGASGDAGPVSVPSVVADAGVLDGVGALISEGRTSGWATRVNALTGVLTEQSAASGAAPAVFTPDRRWSPDAPGLTALTEMLSTLGSNGVIEGVRLKKVAAGAVVDAVPDYPAEARSQELPTSYLDRIKDNRNAVTALRQTLATTPQTVDPETVLAPLDAALDAAGSTAFRLDPAVGEANLGTVESTTAGITNGVQILSAGNSYTLASSSSPLLLTVQNTLPYNVPVQVRISGGERVGLTVTEPEVQVVPAGRSQQVRIPAEVSRSGQFQVTAQLFAANGVAWGPPVELSVESTAYGALTVVLIVVAGGVLVLMVVLRIMQRLRARRARIEAGGPAGQPTESAVDRDDLEQTALTADQVGTDR